MALVGANFAFEHMYKPQRAKRLFSRHRDIQQMCEREKKELEWEWHTISVQMDKEKNRFTQRAVKLSKRMKEVEERTNMRRITEGMLILAPGENFKPEQQQISGRRKSAMAIPRPPVGGRGEITGVLVRRPATTGVNQSLDTPSDVRPAGRSRSSLNHVVQTTPTPVAGERCKSSRPIKIISSAKNQVQSPGEDGAGRGDSRVGTPREVSPVLSQRRRAASTPGPEQEEGPLRAITPRRKGAQQLQLSLNEQSKLHQSYLSGRVEKFIVKIEAYNEEYRRSMDPKIPVKPDLDEEALAEAENPSNQNSLNSTAQIRNPFAAFVRASKLAVEQTHEENTAKDAPEINVKKVDEEKKKDEKHVTIEDIHPAGGKKKRSPRTSNSKGKNSAESTPRVTPRDPTIKALSKQRVEEFLKKNDEQKKQDTKLRIHKRKMSQVLTEAFTAFEDDINEDNMRKLVAFAAKQKHQLRKARSNSISQIVSAKKAVNIFKKFVSNKKKEKQGALPDDLEEISDRDHKLL